MNLICTELKEIKDRWEAKYPLINFSLWTNEEQTKLFGQISNSNGVTQFKADTVSELINLGEEILREKAND
jgi:hypothetical protein